MLFRTFLRYLPAASAMAVISSMAFAQVNPQEGFRASLVKVLAPLGSNPVLSLTGTDGWLFFQPELRHLTNSFPGNQNTATAAGDARRSKGPLEAIVDFKRQLEGAGISLLVVPVPSKASVYPDKLIPVIPPESAFGEITLDSDYCKALRAEGVETVDLTPLFREKRDSLPLYCLTDSHWSPEGIRVAAEAIASRVTHFPWFPTLSRKEMRETEQPLSFRGDLVSSTNDSIKPEITTLHRVTLENHPVPNPRDSPILLLGDSHDLVFHSGGEMHAESAGLPDHLALRLGIPLDLVAVMGSGATPARRTLARRKDNLSGKKLVIWCFSARDFTEAPSWDRVQVIR